MKKNLLFIFDTIASIFAVFTLVILGMVANYYVDIM